MLLGTVRSVGELARDRGFSPGDRVATLASLSLTPLAIERIKPCGPRRRRSTSRGRPSCSRRAAREHARRHARAARARGARRRRRGASGRAPRRPGRPGGILGAGGKSGCSARQRPGVAWARRGWSSGSRHTRRSPRTSRARALRRRSRRRRADALAVRDAVLPRTAGEAPISRSLRQRPGVELAAIVATRDRGKVYYFAMSTSFTAAALGAEGIGRDVDLFIGNGYAHGHAEHTLAFCASTRARRADATAIRLIERERDSALRHRPQPTERFDQGSFEPHPSLDYRWRRGGDAERRGDKATALGPHSKHVHHPYAPGAAADPGCRARAGTPDRFRRDLRARKAKIELAALDWPPSGAGRLVPRRPTRRSATTGSGSASSTRPRRPGGPYRASTPSGPVDGVLPGLIAPQSIVDGVEIPCSRRARALRSTLTAATVATVFEGDLFEMEDQRNWSDGSFKTYCTPIALGYPHEARAGARLRQRVDVVRCPAIRSRAAPPALDGRRRAARGPDREGRRRHLAPAGPRPGHRVPGLGRAPSSGGPAVAPRGRPRSPADRPPPLGRDWPSRLEAARADASALGARLEVALFVADDNDRPDRDGRPRASRRRTWRGSSRSTSRPPGLRRRRTSTCGPSSKRSLPRGRKRHRSSRARTATSPS